MSSLLGATTSLQNDSFESIIAGYILSLESYVIGKCSLTFLLNTCKKGIKNSNYFSVLN